MFFPVIINWTSPFPILGLLGDIFHFHSYLKRNFCKQTVENLIRRGFAASDLELHCLPMSHKKNARFIWIKMTKMTVEMIQIKFRIKLSLYYLMACSFRFDIKVDDLGPK